MNYSNMDIPSSSYEDDFMELLWENGQIVMQSQSNNPNKKNFSSQSLKLQEKEGGEFELPKINRFGTVDSVANDFSAAGVSDQNGSVAQRDDDLVPWLNLPVDDYSLEFLSEFSGINTSTMPPNDKSSSSFNQVLGVNSHGSVQNVLPKAPNGSLDIGGRSRNSQFNQMQQPLPTSVLSSKSGISDFAAEFTTKSVPQRQDPVSSMLSSTGSAGLVNFSHFTRPVSLMKANLQSSDRLRSNEKASTSTATTTTTAIQSTPVEYSGSMTMVTEKSENKLLPKTNQEIRSTNTPKAANQEDASRDKSKRSSEHLLHGKRLASAENLPGSEQEISKNPKFIITSSSVCSASGVFTTSSYPDNKRKIQEKEESSYQSEDIEDESIGARKATKGRSKTTKRSRAAEVHNLSERRRRDRINEKMRTLQELIPNCNKVDKASMLDEAIEYLKTLQIQLQIMSMHSGLCVPPMMLPPGIQNLRATHMAHFPPMGVGMGLNMGMGMGVGFGMGMGMVDMNGSPMVSMPPVRGPQFPCSVPGNPGMPVMACSSGLQMYGIPSQGLPVPMTSGPPFVPLPVNMVRTDSTHGVSERCSDSVQATGMTTCDGLSNEQMQNFKTEVGQEVLSNDAHVQAPSKVRKECFDKSSNVQIKHNSTHSSDVPMNSTNGNSIHSSSGTSRL